MLIKLLKNSLKIYKVDLSKICRNWVSLVVLGGLILLPSLYAWVNIYASWDPYGNTKGIKISVVNEDKGSSIKGSEVNIGTEVVSSLKENESLGWTFFENREEALAELNKGNVYATIIIPEDFSKKILTLIDKEPVKPQLEYYVNEKINAIAPKITDKGAATIQSQITSSFIETVADKVIEVMHSVGVEVDKQYPTIEKLENMIIGLQDKFPTLEVGLEYLTEKARNGKVFVDRQDQNIIQLEKIISQLIGFNDDITQTLDELSTKPEEVIPEIKEDLILIQTIFADIARSTTELKEAIELNKPVLINDIDQGIAKLEGIKERLTGITNKLGELDQDISSTVSDVEHELISTLNDYINALEELKLNLDTPEGALKVLSKIEHIHYKLADQIQSLRKTIEGVAEGIDGQLAKLQYILEKIEAIKPLHDLEKAPSASYIISSDEELRVLEENSNTELDTNFLSEIEDILALVGEAKENMSHNKELFSDALYLLEDMEDSLTAMKDGFNNSSLVEEKLGQLKVQGRGLSSVVGTIRARIDVKVNGILDKLSTVEQIMREVASGANGLKNIIMSVTSGVREKVEEIVDNIEKVQDKLEDVAHKVIKASHSKVDKVETKVEDIKVNLAELEKRLGKLNSVLEDRGVLEETLQNIAQLNFNIQASLDQTIDLLDAD
ncbi:YhgE/Pip domain-containing protein, partial [Zhenhengia sp.]|uniref:YhgE/Pip domain-containing protein n=1 Tax=Zhenhengia sp. TaxID=2944208 RepID=UPI003079F7D2